MNKDSAFSSERLYFRGINETDTEYLTVWRSCPEIIRYFRHPRPVTRESHMQWYENSYKKNMRRFDCIIFEKKTGLAIGTVGVNDIDYEQRSCEISYMIAEPSCRRRGYATEAIAAMMKRMTVEGIFRFFAEVHEENTASRRTIEKLNYTCYKRRLPFIIYWKQEEEHDPHTC